MVSQGKKRPIVSCRPIVMNDKAMIWRWRNQPNVSKFMYNANKIDWSTHKQWFEKTIADSESQYWIIVADDRDVGLACILNINDIQSTANWAFYIADDSLRGAGIGNVVELLVCIHAFEKLKLRRICCEVLDWNKSIIRMHVKFGFVKEGVRRKHVMSLGAPCDVILFGLLAEEWEKVKKSNLKRLKRAGFCLSEIHAKP